jgi:hypothetical protein
MAGGAAWLTLNWAGPYNSSNEHDALASTHFAFRLKMANSCGNENNAALAHCGG